MKEKINNIVFIVSTFIILVLSISFVIKKPNVFSENENRYLAQFPIFSFETLKNGRYISGIEDYINDQFPLRNSFVGLKTEIELLLGKKVINDIYITDNELIPAFKMNNDYNKIIDTLNNFKNNTQANVMLMLAPNAIDIYPEKVSNIKEQNNGLEEIKKIYSNFKGNSINISTTFLSLKDKDNLYYKTDHHWTTYGAYYAYQEYLGYLGLPNTSFNNYNIKKYEGFYGTSYSKTNYYSVKSDDIYLFEDDNNYEVNYVVENKKTGSLYNYDYLEKKDKYSVFLDNNHALIEIDNLNNNSGKRLLLVKNSYGNSFAPFVAANYDRISVIDLRYYKLAVSDYVENNNIDDVLILFDINGIYTDASIYKLR